MPHMAVLADRLTDLERETLTPFAGGRSYTQIAETRAVGTVTVRNTLYRIQEKQGVGTKQELVIWAVRNGLVDDVMRASRIWSMWLWSGKWRLASNVALFPSQDRVGKQQYRRNAERCVSEVLHLLRSQRRSSTPRSR